MHERLPFAPFLAVLLASLMGTPIPAASWAASSPENDAALDPPGRARLRGTHHHLPLSFEVNHGQTDPSVKFLARAGGYGVFLTPTEAVLTLRRAASPEEPPRRDLEAMISESGPPAFALAALRLRLLGANSDPRMSVRDELPGKVGYFLGRDPASWRTGIPTYAQVRYEAVYPGIDLVFYGNGRQLEFDFVIAPGVDPTVIRLAIANAEEVALTAGGELVMGVAAEQVRMRAPVIYQERDGRREEVSGGYLVLPTREGQSERSTEIGFRTGAYDPGRSLVIDPVLVYSTYLGGSGDFDAVQDFAVDAAGNTYLAGFTTSLDFPTGSALQATHAGGFYDVFVTKLSPAGTVVFSTYIGGSGGDLAHHLAVDGQGAIHVAGQTTSSNFPTVAPVQAAYGGGEDVFVAKLSPTGAALQYSTYLGGSLQEAVSPITEGAGIRLDASGNAIITGQTSSVNFPVANAAQAVRGGSLDAFVTKLDPGGAFVYSTYLGGGGAEFVQHVELDPSGNAYVVGGTTSGNFPTVNAVQTIYGGHPICCPGDSFITKLSPTGGFVYSTFLGGNGFDGSADFNNSTTDLAVDASGNAYIAGFTSSTNFPTSNALQPTPGSDRDIFLTKLNPGGGFVYSTYVGGNGLDSQPHLAVTPAGEAYLAGASSSSNLPTTPSALQSVRGGFDDVFLTKVDAAGTAILYYTYLGGSSNESPRDIALDASGSVYVVGFTGSSNFPTVNAAQPAAGGGGSFSDTFVTKVDATGAAVYSTYIGGSGSDSPFVFVADPTGSLYVAGSTTSPNFPAIGAVQGTYGGGMFIGDAFVTKLTGTGAFAYSTYLGGSGDERAHHLGVDASGRAHVAGSTTSPNFPTVNALKTTRGGTSDSFAALIADNQLPTAEAGGPYFADEGDSLPLDGSGSGDDGALVRYEWDCENDTVFDVTSASPTGDTCAYADDGDFTLRLRVTDDGDTSADDTAPVTVANVAPRATFANDAGAIIQGQSALLTFSDPSDPSPADVAAGLQFAYDCDDDGTFEVSLSLASSHACSYPMPGAFLAGGRIEDKDGGATDYTVVVNVLSPREGIDLLIQKVNDLVASGRLPSGPAGGLIAKLEAAAQQLDKGNPNPAVNQLQAFISQVNALVGSGQLAAQDGQDLIVCANQIIAALGG